MPVKSGYFTVTKEGMISSYTIISVVIVGGGVVYFGACLAAFGGLFRQIGRNPDYSPSVSVIIPARNEEHTIGALLDDLAAQDYPSDKMEIIVVDDCSEDGTSGIVRERKSQNTNIGLIDTGSSKSPYTHKKRAVHEGILASGGEIIMTTDADCRVPAGWISGMIERFTPETDLAAGMVSIHGGGITGMLEALEITGIQTMAAGFMNAGFPVTCNGANLAYRRSAFDRVGGFDGIGHIVSGDDDLLMQKIAGNQPSRVRFITGQHTAVRTGAAESAVHFFQSRARWASKITGYPSKSATGLLTVFFLYFTALLIQPVLLVVGYGSLLPFAAGFGLKLCGDFLLTACGTIQAGRLGLILLFPLGELLHIPYIIAVSIWGTFGTFEWRGRKTSAVSSESGECGHVR